MPGGIPGIRSGFTTTRGMDWEREKTVTDTAAKEGAASTRACVCVCVATSLFTQYWEYTSVLEE